MKRKFTDLVSMVGTTPARFSGEKRYISTGAVDQFSIDEAAVEMVTYTNRPSRANLTAQKGDVLFAKMAETLKTLCLDDELANNIYSTGFCAIRAREQVIMPQCLYYLVSSPTFLSQKDQNASGATQRAITNAGLANIYVNVPTLEEQEKAIKTLDFVSSLIAKRKTQLAAIDDLVKSQFIEMFGDPIDNQYHWSVVTIGDVVTEVRYGTSRPAVDGGKYPYLRMNNITYDGRLDLSDVKYIDIPDGEIDKCLVRKGDILFNRTNSVELVGKTCMFGLDTDMVIAGYIIRVRLNDKLLPIVLSNYMNLPVIKRQMRDMAKGAVNQANINAQELQSIKVYLPPIELQNKFARFVEQTDKSKVLILKNKILINRLVRVA